MAMDEIREIGVSQTDIDRILHGSDFVDNFIVPIEDHSLTLGEAARRAFDKSPKWVEMLLAMRNFLVKPFGLKGAAKELEQVKNLPKEEVFGFFPVISRTDDEIVLGFDDSHLNFRIRIYFQQVGNKQGLCAATMVRTHNVLGRSYMTLIKPFHRMIVPAMLRQVG